jgi:hypothetical protein
MDENRDLDREVSALVQSMMKEMDSDVSDTPALEQAIVTLVNAFRDAFLRHGERIHALETRVAQLEASQKGD